MSQRAPLNIKNCSIFASGNFDEFYTRNFDTISKTMWGRDNSITGEDLAQEAMLYMWKNFWKGKSQITLEKKGFHSAVNQVVWLRLKCRQLISNTTVIKELRSRFPMVSMDNVVAKEQALSSTDTQSVANTSAIVSEQGSIDIMEIIYQRLQLNFPDNPILVRVLMAQMMGYNVKEIWDIFKITKHWYYANYTKFEEEVFEGVKAQLLKEFSE